MTPMVPVFVCRMSHAWPDKSYYGDEGQVSYPSHASCAHHETWKRFTSEAHALAFEAFPTHCLHLLA